MIRLFISYRSLDSAKVDAIVARLRSLKDADGKPVFHIWQDKTSIPPGTDWWQAIIRGIIDCHIFVFMVSAESVQNINCRAELTYARKRNRPIIPFVLEDEYTYSTISGKHDISFWEHVPHELTDAKLQFLFYEGVSFVSQLESAIQDIQSRPWRDIPAPPPPDPRHAGDTSNDTGSIYDQACDYAHRLEFGTAERLFQRLIDLNDALLADDAYEWIILLRNYEEIMRLSKRTSTRHKALERWQAYERQFPKPFTPLFDPKGFEKLYNQQAETERIARKQAEAQGIAQEQAEAERKAHEQAEAERKAHEQAEAERKAQEQADADRIAWEQAEAQRIAREQAEAQRIAQEQAEAQRIAREQAEAQRLAQEKAEAQRKPRRQTYRSTSTPFNRLGVNQVVAIAVFSIVLIAGALVIITAPRNTLQATPTNTPESTATNTPSPTLTPLEEALQRARNFTGTQNSDWTPFEHDFDGVTMVLVPAGCFTMGSDNGGSDEQPVHEQCFDEPFWIDKYEVTNEQYGSTGCTDWSSQSDQPRNCVSWFDANDYCQSRNAQLPTEAQWEYAARGVESWIYPWGNDFVGDNAVYSSNSGSRTADVGSRPNGASWVGAMDMAGNVWEWTSSLYESYPYDADDGRERDTGDRTDVRRVLRGGSFFNSSDGLRSAFRSWVSPIVENFNVGLRCLRSY